jgi:hypothetical protein
MALCRLMLPALAAAAVAAAAGAHAAGSGSPSDDALWRPIEPPAADAVGVAPWVPMPPPIACGDVMQPNNTICIYLRNNCSDVVSLHRTVVTIGPNNSWTVPPAPTFTNGTWFSFPSLSLAPNGTKGFAVFTANVFYNATLVDGQQHEFGFGCIFSAVGYDCSFNPGKHFDAQPDMQVEPAPSYVALLMFKKGGK